jgi:hypothetical protein
VEVDFAGGELLLNKSKAKKAKVKSREKEAKDEEDVIEGEVVDCVASAPPTSLGKVKALYR